MQEKSQNLFVKIIHFTTIIWYNLCIGLEYLEIGLKQNRHYTSKG